MKTKIARLIIICISVLISNTTPSLANLSNVVGYESGTAIILKSNTDSPVLHLITHGKEQDDVKPWEGFRGWSPRVPYGQSSKDTSIKPEPEKTTKEGETSLTSKEDSKANNDQDKETIGNKDDDVQPWEGFRGWSPRVPY